MTVVTVVYLSLPVRIQQKVTLDDGEPRTLEVRCVSEMCFIALEVQETSFSHHELIKIPILFYEFRSFCVFFKRRFTDADDLATGLA